MGVCMGKDTQLSDLDTDGRFTSQFGNEISTTMITTKSTINSAVRFSEPRVPVIFILGGPGSGKITHCDRAVQERHGLAHVNMTDLIQQHIVGNGLEDFNQMLASHLVQVLMMEMKMAVNASGFLISGYPRSMRDVVEYSEKVRRVFEVCLLLLVLVHSFSKLHRVDKVILLNWHVKILEKQIEFGAQLGDTVLQLARMELRNYSKSVVGVADYFDQMKKLCVVDGERQPTDVYADFLAAVDVVFSKHPLHNGGIPTQNNKAQFESEIIPAKNTKRYAIWVIGGPGSNKSLLSSNSRYPWKQISIGVELRNILNGKHNYSTRVGGEESPTSIRKMVNKGELVSNDIVMKMITDFMRQHTHVVIDGFPRNVGQIKIFEEQTGLRPPCILVDCSEVELGRSLGQRKPERGDNDAAAVKSRLMIYRVVTLPALKILDDQQRLHIVDGDSEPSKVVSEFTATMNDVMNSLEHGIGPVNNRKPSTDTIRAMYQELEDE